MSTGKKQQLPDRRYDPENASSVHEDAGEKANNNIENDEKYQNDKNDIPSVDES